MSDEVEVAFSANNQETAVLLLAAAEDLGLDPSVVRTSEGAFIVPQEVSDKAFGKGKTEAPDTAKVQAEADAQRAEEEGRAAPSAENGEVKGYEQKKPAAKKAAAKKSAAKKS